MRRGIERREGGKGGESRIGRVVPWFHCSHAAWERESKGLLHLKCAARHAKGINQTDRRRAPLPLMRGPP